MATHSSILAWRIPRTEEPGGLQPMGSESNMTEHTRNITTIDVFVIQVQINKNLQEVED